MMRRHVPLPGNRALRRFGKPAPRMEKRIVTVLHGLPAGIIRIALLCFVLVLPAGALAQAQPAPQQQIPNANPSHEEILRGFDASALWASREDVTHGVPYNPTGMIVKWQKPIIYRIDGSGTRPEMVNLAINTLRRQAAIAGIEVRPVAGNEAANYTLIFRTVANFDLGDRKAICTASQAYNTGGHMQHVTLQINLAAPNLERCVRHEVLHSFGLINHPQRLYSVLSYYTGNAVTDITEADQVMLLVLYDPRMKTGMSRPAALVLADSLIEEKRRALNPRAPPRTGTAVVLRDALADLQAAANTGNVRAQLYLAEAAWKGYGMTPDPARMQAMLERAAATRDIVSRFDVAFALLNGSYVPKDEARAALLFQRNAELGHVVSQNNFAVLLRDGRGVTMDKLSALTWFTIAARGNHAPAERARVSLAATLPPDQQEIARQRAAAWKPRAEAVR
jgi:TPR repeat protein